MKAKPVLLKDEAQALLAMVTASASEHSPEMVPRLVRCRRLLSDCCAHGLDAAFAAARAAEEGAEQGPQRPRDDVPLDDLPLGETIQLALRLAGEERSAETPLDTAVLFAALARTAPAGEWERLALDAAPPESLGSAGLADPEPEAGASWHGTPLTRTATAALRDAGHSAQAQDRLPIPPAVLAMALVSNPRSAAARALTGGRIDHDALLRLLSEALDTPLPATYTPQSTPGAELPAAERTALIARLQGRINLAMAVSDGGPTQSADSEADARTLAQTLGDPADDLTVSRVLGWWHWTRCGVPFRRPTNRSEMRSALIYLQPVYLVAPEDVPVEVRDGFEQQRALHADRGDSLRALNDRVSELLGRGDLGSVDEAIALLRRAASSMPDGHQARPALLAVTGQALGARFQLTGDRADADAAVDSHRSAVAAGGPRRADLHDALGTALLERYQVFADQADISAAVTSYQQAAHADPKDPGIWSNLAAALQHRYERTRTDTDCRAAVVASAHAVDVCPSDDPDLAGYRHNLGDALRLRATATDSDDDLENAITAHRQALTEARSGPIHRMVLAGLALDLRERYLRGHDLTDLDEAIQCMRQAVATPGTSEGERAALLSNLGALIEMRVTHTASAADHDEAISILNEAVEATPATDPRLRSALSNLAAAYYRRFTMQGAADDLRAALREARKAVEVPPQDTPEHWVVESNLAGLLLAEYRRSGAEAVLDEAVERARQAALGAHAPTRVREILACVLLDRYRRGGTVADLDEVIRVRQSLVAALPDRHADRPGCELLLAEAQLARYDGTGDPDALDAAITAAQASVDAAPAGHRQRPQALTNLAIYQHLRYERTGAAADLDEAIGRSRSALVAFADSDLNRAPAFAALGDALVSRARRRARTADLDEAVDAYQRAVASTGRDDVIRGAYLVNLGTALRDRYRLSGVETDLDGALEVHEQAVAVTPAGHPNRPFVLAALAVGLRTRHEHTGDPVDLDRAISVAEQALTDFPAESPRRTRAMANLGALLHARAGRADRPDDLARARAHFRAGWQSRSASIEDRIEAARGWARSAVQAADWADATLAYAAAIELLGPAAARTLPRTDQEHRLTGLTGFGSAAAACALNAGEDWQAVALWEQGRGVLLGRDLDARTDLSRLAEVRDDLATEYTTLCTAFEQAESPMSGLPFEIDPLVAAAKSAEPRPGAHRIARNRAQAEQLDALVEKIRALPGLDDFLRPPTPDALRSAAAAGAVAMINVNDLRSDALLVDKDGVEVVRLPDLDPQALRIRVGMFLAATRDAEHSLAESRQNERELITVLEWLWDAVAEPILSRHSSSGATTTAPARRLWWCPSGLLSLLPLHAAGYHQRQDTVLDHVQSSYAPTLRALAHSRRANDQALAWPPGALAVSMPSTPGQDALPTAELEIAKLRALLGSSLTVLEGPAATRNAVTSSLPGHDWAHVAGHATADLANPSYSRILLSDHQFAPLTVAHLSRQRLDAELAFLSACQTSVGGTSLPDEAIHLASALQLAGYRHVIATLWSVRSVHAATIAKGFYTALKDAAEHGRPLQPAAALHQTVLQLRDQFPSRPSRWAAHIHAGA